MKINGNWSENYNLTKFDLLELYKCWNGVIVKGLYEGISNLRKLNFIPKKKIIQQKARELSGEELQAFRKRVMILERCTKVTMWDIGLLKVWIWTLGNSKADIWGELKEKMDSDTIKKKNKVTSGIFTALFSFGEHYRKHLTPLTHNMDNIMLRGL